MAFKLFKKKEKKKKKSVSTKEKNIENEKDIARGGDNEKHFLKPEKKSNETVFVSRLRDGLSKTRKIFSTDIGEIFSLSNIVDQDLLEEVEELLITSDVGVAITNEIMQAINKKFLKTSNAAEFKSILKEQILSYINPLQSLPDFNLVEKPFVIMVVGVNGVGKTTTIGKLAAKYTSSGKKVLIAASDTFRAAAIEQLEIWAARAGATCIKHKEKTDPASVAYDCMQAAAARNADVVIVDTAGRVQTNINLMEELKKIKRVISQKLPDAPHELLLVLDATTGQNALSQAKAFHEALNVTGIALTKLDGTAKGGIVINICHTLKIPLKYVGIGEKIDDLQNFKPNEFVEAMFS